MGLWEPRGLLGVVLRTSDLRSQSEGAALEWDHLPLSTLLSSLKYISASTRSGRFNSYIC